MSNTNPNSPGWFLTQSWIIYIVGIKLWMHLQSTGASSDAANIACFFVTLLLTIIVSEVFHRVVDYPADALTKRLFKWMCE